MRRDTGIPIPSGASQELVAVVGAIERFIIDREKQPKLVPAYTRAQLATLDPADWVNCIVICTDDHGGRCLAESDGINWLHCTDGTPVS